MITQGHSDVIALLNKNTVYWIRLSAG